MITTATNDLKSADVTITHAPCTDKTDWLFTVLLLGHPIPAVIVGVIIELCR